MGCKLFKTAAVSANQHQSSSSKVLVKCCILCDKSVEKFFIFRKDLWKCIHVCEWNNLCFVYSAEECIKDREVVPTDLVNKVKKTSNLIICLRSRSSVSSRGTFGKKFRSGVFHVPVCYFLIKITSLYINREKLSGKSIYLYICTYMCYFPCLLPPTQERAFTLYHIIF